MSTREIKFRAWVIEDNKMYDVLSLECGFGRYDYDETLKDEVRLVVGTEAVGVILMQYTGRKDSEGKEIYEGDIVVSQRDHTPNHIKGIVEFGRYSYTEFVGEYGDYNDEHYFYGWHCPTLTYCRETYNNFINGKYVVIGNIYENPELLEDKD